MISPSSSSNNGFGMPFFTNPTGSVPIPMTPQAGSSTGLPDQTQSHPLQTDDESPFTKIKEKVSEYVGKLSHKTNFLGVCTLIGNDKVLTARHVVTSLPLNEINVSFLNQKLFLIKCSLEDDASLDYAILKITDFMSNEFVPISVDYKPTESMLAHYQENTLIFDTQNSVDTGNLYSICHKSHHQTEPGFSGAPHFNYQGEIIAMHLGSESLTKEMEDTKYSLIFSDINDRCLLRSLIEPNHSPVAVDDKTWLDENESLLEIDLESCKSRKLFFERFPGLKESHDNIEQNTIIENLKNLKTENSNEYNKFIFSCLEQNPYPSIYKKIKKYSWYDELSSDHILPSSVLLAVWKNKTGFESIDKYHMPAMLIPQELHGILETTKNGNFRQDLEKLCVENKYSEALKKCFEDYKEKLKELRNLKPIKLYELETYRISASNYLEWFVDKNFIKEDQKTDILNYFLK